MAAYESPERCAEAVRFASWLLEDDTKTPPQERIRDDLQTQQAVREANASGPTPCSLPPNHRVRLVGWMCEVSRALALNPATAATAVSLMDRFLQATAAQVPPPEGLLQLLALACMSVAVKYDEVTKYAPAVWLHLAVDPSGALLYTPRDLQRMEFSLLQTLGWRLHVPTTHTFLFNYLACIAGATSSAAAGGSSPGPDSTRWAVVGADTMAMQGMDAVPPAPLPRGLAPTTPPSTVSTWAAGRAGAAAYGPESPAPCSGCVPFGFRFTLGRAEGRPKVTEARAVRGPVPPAGGVGGSVEGGSGGAGGSDCCCCHRCSLKAFGPVASRALMLAELSLMHEAFLSYDPSTVALACVALADAGGAFCAPSSSAFCTPAALTAASASVSEGFHLSTASASASAAITAVASACGLPLELLAPGLAACMRDLEACCWTSVGAL